MSSTTCVSSHAINRRCITIGASIGIGSFQDDPARLRAAADYLDASRIRKAG